MAKFVKGQSGNPKGRPPKSVEDAKKSVLDQLFDVSAEERVIRAMIREAESGSVAAFRALYERKYGKVTAPEEQDTVTEVIVSYGDED